MEGRKSRWREARKERKRKRQKEREQVAGAGKDRPALQDVCPDPFLVINTSNYAQD